VLSNTERGITKIGDTPMHISTLGKHLHLVMQDIKKIIENDGLGGFNFELTSYIDV